MKKIFTLPSFILIIVLLMANGLQAQPTTWEPGDPGLTNTNTIAIKEVVSLSMYPNPSQGQVNLVIPNNSGTVVIAVYNMSGKIIHQQVAASQDQVLTVKMNFARVAPGTYMVRVLNNKKLMDTLRLIINPTGTGLAIR